MGKNFILVLTSDIARLRFMSMYEQNFVLRWVMSVSAAEEIARLERYDFALVNYDSDPQRAMDFCERLKKVQPRTRIVYLKARDTVLPRDFCADVVLDSALAEPELAAQLRQYIAMPA